MKQGKIMKFCPNTGAVDPVPNTAYEWRQRNKFLTWYYNPWTGEERSVLQVAHDATGWTLNDEKT